jgi:membrane fusion protein, copper/silver efflux system
MKMKTKIKIGYRGWIMLLCSLLLLFFAAGCRHEIKEQVAENEFYVCSMDPQVMEKHPGMCPICKMPLAKTMVDTKQLNSVHLSDEQARLGNIRIERVAVSSVGRGTTLTGVFAIDQNRTEQISARIKGRVEHLYFKVAGSQIRAGDKLYNLYSPDLLLAQQEYMLAREKGKLLSTGAANVIAAAKNKLSLWGLTESQIAALEKTGEPKITNTIYSKVSGAVIEIPLKDGDYVNEGAGIYKVANLGALWVEAQLFTNELAYLNEGQQAEISPVSYPGEHIAGKVVFVNPELQDRSKISLIRIEVNNAAMRYKPGMQANILLKSEPKKVIALPMDAVLQNSRNSIVWVETRGNTFEPRIVITGIQADDRIEILSGLNDSDRVVVSGAYLLNSEYVFKHGINPLENNKTTKSIPQMDPNMKM